MHNIDRDIKGNMVECEIWKKNYYYYLFMFSILLFKKKKKTPKNQNPKTHGKGDFTKGSIRPGEGNMIACSYLKQFWEWRDP